jgi:hypothetical protein
VSIKTMCNVYAKVIRVGIDMLSACLFSRAMVACLVVTQCSVYLGGANTAPVSVKVVVVDSADRVKVLVQKVTLIVAGSPGVAVTPPTNDDDVGVGTIGSTSAIVTNDVAPSANV